MVRYVSFTRNFGHQQALRAGLHRARGRAVVVMDADFEHPPELIPELIAAWRSGAKIVATQRIDDKIQVSVLKRLTSQLYYRLLNMISVQVPPADCAACTSVDYAVPRDHVARRRCHDGNAYLA
jgi:dolichol-phosphate mannosyltransferase